MPTYSIQLPDGRVADIEAGDEATAIRGAREWHGANPKKPSLGEAIDEGGPGFLKTGKAAWDAATRLMTGPGYQPGERTPENDQIIKDSLTAGGAAMTGSVPTVAATAAKAAMPKIVTEGVEMSLPAGPTSVARNPILAKEAAERVSPSLPNAATGPVRKAAAEVVSEMPGGGVIAKRAQRTLDELEESAANATSKEATDDVAMVKATYGPQLESLARTTTGLGTGLGVTALIHEPMTALAGIAATHGVARVLARPAMHAPVMGWAGAFMKAATNPTAANVGTYKILSRNLASLLAKEGADGHEIAAKLEGSLKLDA